MGACRYCGQALPDQSATLQGLATGYGPGNTSPTLPKQDQPPAPTDWNNTTNNAKTQFGPLTFAQPNVPEQGTAPFAAQAPAAYAPPNGGIAPQNASPIVSAPPPIYYPPAKPARKSGGKILALAIIVVILLLAVIGGGLIFARGFNKPSASSGTTVTASSPTSAAQATPTATATPTPTPTPTLSGTYSDPNGLFSIRYPGDWTHEDTSPAGANFPLPLNGVRFHSGDAELVILTGQEVQGLPNDGLPEQSNAALLASMNAQNVSSPTPRQIGGRAWTAQNADTDGGKRTVIASVNFNGHLYTLWYSAPASEFNADEQRDFNPMVASFTFGG